MRMTKIAIFAALVGLLLGGAYLALAQKTSVSSSSESGLIPLAVGNQWSYIRTDTDEIAHSQVEKSQSVKGNTWYLYNEFGDRFWVRNEGLNQFEAADFFDTDFIDGDDIDEVKVINADKDSYSFDGIESASYKKCPDEITVPAGTFSCHIVIFDLGDGLHSEHYYAEGVGLLRHIYRSGEDRTMLELTDYQLF